MADVTLISIKFPTQRLLLLPPLLAYFPALSSYSFLACSDATAQATSTWWAWWPDEHKDCFEEGVTSNSLRKLSQEHGRPHESPRSQLKVSVCQPQPGSDS